MDETTKVEGLASNRPVKRKTLAERMVAAKAREAKAAETLRRRKVKVQKYQSQQRTFERRLDTRRKIIAGALALEHMRRGGGFRAEMLTLLDAYVVRDDERELFGLEPIAAADPRRLRAAGVEPAEGAG